MSLFRAVKLIHTNAAGKSYNLAVTLVSRGILTGKVLNVDNDAFLTLETKSEGTFYIAYDKIVLVKPTWS